MAAAGGPPPPPGQAGSPRRGGPLRGSAGPRRPFAAGLGSPTLTLPFAAGLSSSPPSPFPFHSRRGTRPRAKFPSRRGTRLERRRERERAAPGLRRLSIRGGTQLLLTLTLTVPFPFAAGLSSFSSAPFHSRRDSAPPHPSISIRGGTRRPVERPRRTRHRLRLRSSKGRLERPATTCGPVPDDGGIACAWLARPRGAPAPHPWRARYVPPYIILLF